MRRRLATAAAAAVALTLVFVSPPQSATTPKLAGTVGPGFTISLKKAGKKVTRLAHRASTRS